MIHGGKRVLLSMTGFGEARYQGDSLQISTEVRTVNNRYLKVSVRGTDPYPMLDNELEKIVRKYIRRGTVTIHLRVDRQSSTSDVSLNAAAFTAYAKQLQELSIQANIAEHLPVLLSQLLTLPGVAPLSGGMVGRPDDHEMGLVEQVLEQAFRGLHAMRQAEGKSMADELMNLKKSIHMQLMGIRQRVPTVVANHRQRLRERVNTVLTEHQISLRAEDLIREVAIFADRSDVSEEVVRLDSHLEQLETVIRKETDSPGRRLEFLVQEMGREANTIGSKANDVQISFFVVEIKATLEKIRELVQNIE
jgi:uncharacterized protein (TIGR00255 family)